MSQRIPLLTDGELLQLVREHPRTHSLLIRALFPRLGGNEMGTISLSNSGGADLPAVQESDRDNKLNYSGKKNIFKPAEIGPRVKL